MEHDGFWFLFPWLAKRSSIRTPLWFRSGRSFRFRFLHFYWVTKSPIKLLSQNPFEDASDSYKTGNSELLVSALTQHKVRVFLIVARVGIKVTFSFSWENETTALRYWLVRIPKTRAVSILASHSGLPEGESSSLPKRCFKFLFDWFCVPFLGWHLPLVQCLPCRLYQWPCGLWRKSFGMGS